MFDFANSTGFSFIIIIINDETLIESIFYQTISSEHFLADKMFCLSSLLGWQVFFFFFFFGFIYFEGKLAKKKSSETSDWCMLVGRLHGW